MFLQGCILDTPTMNDTPDRGDTTETGDRKGDMITSDIEAAKSITTPGDRNQRAVLEYDNERDYDIEPLDPEAAASILYTTNSQITATPLDDTKLSVTIPARQRGIAATIERLSEWGFDIDSFQYHHMGVPQIEIIAAQSPNPIKQLVTILTADDVDPDVLLDGFVLAINHKHADGEETISIAKWAELRGETVETIRENLQTLRDKLDQAGGLEGTQWEMRKKHK